MPSQFRPACPVVLWPARPRRCGSFENGGGPARKLSGCTQGPGERHRQGSLTKLNLDFLFTGWRSYQRQCQWNECRGLRWNVRDDSLIGFEQLVATTELVLLEPAMEHIGVHRMLRRQCRDGGARLLACRHQLGLELRRVSPVAASGRWSGNL